MLILYFLNNIVRLQQKGKLMSLSCRLQLKEFWTFRSSFSVYFLLFVKESRVNEDALIELMFRSLSTATTLMTHNVGQSSSLANDDLNDSHHSLHFKGHIRCHFIFYKMFSTKTVPINTNWYFSRAILLIFWVTFSLVNVFISPLLTISLFFVLYFLVKIVQKLFSF